MGKLWEKLKSYFTLTPDQLKYAENELRSIFGMISYCKKEKER